MSRHTAHNITNRQVPRIPHKKQLNTVTSVPLMIRQEVETRRARRKSPVRGRSPVKHRIPERRSPERRKLRNRSPARHRRSPHRVFRYIVTRRRTIFSRLSKSHREILYSSSAPNPKHRVWQTAKPKIICGMLDHKLVYE